MPPPTSISAVCNCWLYKAHFQCLNVWVIFSFWLITTDTEPSKNQQINQPIHLQHVAYLIFMNAWGKKRLIMSLKLAIFGPNIHLFQKTISPLCRKVEMASWSLWMFVSSHPVAAMWPNHLFFHKRFCDCGKKWEWLWCARCQWRGLYKRKSPQLIQFVNAK